MKRDMDLVRKLLLKTEELCGAGDFHTFEEEDFPDTTEKEVYEHARLLFERGYLRETSQTLSYSVCVSGLIWEGHEFLDSVRNPEIWRKTKETANAAGGWTMGLLGEIAKGLIKTKIQKHTGVNL